MEDAEQMAEEGLASAGKGLKPASQEAEQQQVEDAKQQVENAKQQVEDAKQQPAGRLKLPSHPSPASELKHTLLPAQNIEAICLLPIAYKSLLTTVLSKVSSKHLRVYLVQVKRQLS